MKTLLTFFVCFILLAPSSDASHIIGSEISYTYITGNTYEIKLTTYRDCWGIPAATSMVIYYSSVSAGVNATSVNLPIDLAASGYDILPTCNPSLSTCNGGTLPGIEKSVYRGNIVLPQAASDWLFYSSDCCRSAAITNLMNGAGEASYIYAYLDNLNNPFNNSPQFANDPVVLISDLTTNTINNGIYDPDGDSLSFTLVSALNDANSPVTYAPGFTATNPIYSVPPMSIDPYSGDVTVTPVGVQVAVVVYQITEFRNGNPIGTVMRDMTLYVVSTTNNLPSINYTYPFIATACYGDTLNLNIVTSDINLGDSTFIDTMIFNFPAQYSITPGLNESAQFQFVPDSTMISSNPYLLQIRIRDNACDFNGQQSYTFRIFVNNCDSTVWPGDANADLNDNIYDILPIGIGYGATGSTRAGASINWIAQPATPWSQSFYSGVNYMHADCNGDGIIDMNDTNAIYFNYGLNHPLRRINPGDHIASTGSVFLVGMADTIQPGSDVQFEVHLGSGAEPADTIYGVAFRIYFDPALIDPAFCNFNFTNSWLGNPGQDLVTMCKKDWTNGYVDIGLVRTNHQDTSGFGLLGTLTLRINNNAGLGNLIVSCDNIQGITASEVPLYFQHQDDTVLVNPYVGMNETIHINPFSVFPNPANNVLVIKNHFLSVYNFNLEVFNVLGETVLTEPNLSLRPGNEIRLNVSELENGIYFLRTGDGLNFPGNFVIRR